MLACEEILCCSSAIKVIQARILWKCIWKQSPREHCRCMSIQIKVNRRRASGKPHQHIRRMKLQTIYQNELINVVDCSIISSRLRSKPNFTLNLVKQTEETFKSDEIIHETPHNQQPKWNARLCLLVIAAMNNKSRWSLQLFLEACFIEHMEY